jgi:hypothetical protein
VNVQTPLRLHQSLHALIAPRQAGCWAGCSVLGGPLIPRHYTGSTQAVPSTQAVQVHRQYTKPTCGLVASTLLNS